MEIPKNFIFMAYDGDHVGSRVGRATMANDLDELQHISGLIKEGHRLVKRWVKDHGGIWINGGGDEGLGAIPEEAVDEIEQLRKDYEYLVGHTISIGIGKEPSESGRALLIAKLKGKNQTVKFSKATEKEILRIKKRAKKGAFKSMEEHKLAEAYLKKGEESDSCPYCEQSDGIDPDHCQWCHDAEFDQEETCPYCKGSQNDPSMGPKEPEISDEDCEFCKEKDQKGKEECEFCKEGPEALVSPDSNNEDAHPNTEKEREQAERMGMHPPEIGKPDDPDQRPPIGQNAPMDVEPKDIGNQDPNQKLSEPRDVPQGSETIDPEDNHSKKALMNIADQIKDAETPLASQVDAIGEEDINSGSDMEGNISRPEGYNQNTPSDMGEEGPNGVSESNDDEPDLGSVLEEGLDQHADSIQREKSIQMVSQALTQFKTCKDMLEQSKAQMPQLYQASISMLKAMIAMAGSLKLGESASIPQESTLGQEQASLEPPSQENEWYNPFPVHPDHGGEEKPGHAPSSESQTNADGTGQSGAIGQPIGKLSSKHTTKHTARTPMPIGAVNEKGQKKVMDDQGKVRFINMKQGMVQGASGVPVKPPKRV